MNEEWLIYRSSPLQRLAAMKANNYDEWTKGVTQFERERFPAVARGLTQEQAEKMVEMTEEPK